MDFSTNYFYTITPISSDGIEGFTSEVYETRSYPDGGFYSWHTEQGRGEYSSNRMGVFMVYLNTVNKGGKTEFKHYELDVKPEKGTLIYWPASYTHRHRAAPDLKEDKYILTGWLSYSRKRDRDGDNS